MKTITKVSRVFKTRTGAYAAANQGTSLFVPLTDELMYEHPEQIPGELVAYEPGHLCAHWLNVELNPVDEPPIVRRPAPGHGATEVA